LPRQYGKPTTPRPTSTESTCGPPNRGAPTSPELTYRHPRGKVKTNEHLDVTARSAEGAGRRRHAAGGRGRGPGTREPLQERSQCSSPREVRGAQRRDEWRDTHANSHKPRVDGVTTLARFSLG